jgi:hypothetical protein
LGAAWEGLDDTQKIDGERRFFSTLLLFLSRLGEATFVVELSDQAQLNALIQNLGDAVEAERFGMTVTGRLMPGAVAMLVTIDPGTLGIRVAGENRLSLHDSWTGVAVRLTIDEAYAFQNSSSAY